MSEITPSSLLAPSASLKQLMIEITNATHSSSASDIIVFSHLRWEFVTQRPQHIIERLAKNNRRVLFVEEPIDYKNGEEGTARTIQPSSTITVIQPKIKPGDFSQLQSIIKQQMPNDFSAAPLLWFYSPAFVSMLDYLDYSTVVYDCMDELSQFKGAPTSLVQQENTLLSSADVVFTGGKSLYESKKKKHPSVYCFPSSIDTKHFAKALNSGTPIPADLAQLPTPVVGFYGVIDERLDLELIADVAKSLPQLSFALIGPVVKISESDLPQADNIYYLGPKDYKELPSYLKGFAIAYMPFALNEATEFISPTKTLEFMAAYKPIVSTPIYDVKRDYSKEVKVVATAEQMKQAILEYVHEGQQARVARERLQKAVLSKTSWDKTVKEMEGIIGNLRLAYQAETTSEVSDFSLGLSY